MRVKVDDGSRCVFFLDLLVGDYGNDCWLDVVPRLRRGPSPFLPLSLLSFAFSAAFFAFSFSFSCSAFCCSAAAAAPFVRGTGAVDAPLS